MLPGVGVAGPMFAFAVIAAVMIVVVLRYLPEGPVAPPVVSEPAPIDPETPRPSLLRDPRLTPFLVYGFLVAAAQTAQGQTLGFLIIDLLTCVVAFALERKEDWTLLFPVLLQRFYYRQLMYVVLFRSVKEAVSGRPVGWRGVETEAPTTVVTA